MKLFDARRKTPSLFVERIRERCERQLATAAGEGFPSSGGAQRLFQDTDANFSFHQSCAHDRTIG